MAKTKNTYSHPPKSKGNAITNENLKTILSQLVGSSFILTGKPRTDGSELRKLILKTIEDNFACEGANDENYDIMPLKGKGVPRLLLHFVDTYIVTSGDSYNLQVWNRIPNSESVLVNYTDSDEIIDDADIRYVLVKINMHNKTIESISILSSAYIEKRFGKFGKPTIKHQLLVSEILRNKILLDKVQFSVDTKAVKQLVSKSVNFKPHNTITDRPAKGEIISIETIRDIVVNKIIGMKVDAADTKSRGQLLERIIAKELGYNISEGDKLVGGYPDIPNQLLEIKIQDRQTIDLGKYSPQHIEDIFPECGITTADIRYLIALTNPDTNIIEGAILMPGLSLGKYYTYVSDTSYKCQRSIPMTYFDDITGTCVNDPIYKKP